MSSFEDEFWSSVLCEFNESQCGKQAQYRLVLACSSGHERDRIVCLKHRDMWEIMLQIHQRGTWRACFVCAEQGKLEENLVLDRITEFTK